MREPVSGRLRQKLGALVREARVYLDVVRQRSNGPAVIFFPSQGLDDGAARLRAYAVTDHLRALGWRALVCPKHVGLAGRRRIVRVFRPDVIVMQTARHPLNRPHLFPGVPSVIDLDDADYVDETSRVPLVRALEDSAGVIAGSRSVARFCRRHSDDVAVVWTGTPPSPGAQRPHFDRPRIVTWAASSPLGSREETLFVRAVLDHLAARAIDFEFVVYANDGSDAYDAFLRALIPPGVRYRALPYLGYQDFLLTLDTVAVGLAPLLNMDGFAGGKSFGKVLAYIDRDVPVITHAVVDHPVFFRHGATGLMLETVVEWGEAVARLLDDPVERQRLADAARADFLRRLTTATATRLVDRVLRRIVSRREDARALPRRSRGRAAPSRPAP